MNAFHGKITLEKSKTKLQKYWIIIPSQTITQ